LFTDPVNNTHIAQFTYSPSGGAIPGDRSEAYPLNSGYTRYDVCNSPIVDLGNGTLIVSAYGENTADPALASSFVMTSTDHGHTWGNLTVIGNGPVDSVFYGEPQIGQFKTAVGSLHVGDLMVFTRDETNTTYRCLTSTNTGFGSVVACAYSLQTANRELLRRGRYGRSALPQSPPGRAG
jgi:hypothetical protein